MSDKLTGFNFIEIGYHAERIAKSAHAAYWLEACGVDGKIRCDIQSREIREGLKKIVELLGLELVEAKQSEPV